MAYALADTTGATEDGHVMELLGTLVVQSTERSATRAVRNRAMSSITDILSFEGPQPHD